MTNIINFQRKVARNDIAEGANTAQGELAALCAKLVELMDKQTNWRINSHD